MNCSCTLSILLPEPKKSQVVQSDHMLRRFQEKRNDLLTISEESATPKYRLKHHEIQYSKDNKFETFELE